ncbi:SMU1112c/YaeR family gloxylase I-like metalloprotein [Fusobacterium ulcerans]|uniref:SMU1112c/YaeR family gloxylase I-like metalloprotein n=1 Tax=Fusobacterium ulcerans TaxID=861 RepID=UPI001D0BB39A|nr:VOC family protein [Fusobacterium ulcerans]MCB8564621.1 VOC family protein [Fusobacterium ulcerans]MCB8649080.1 VOC family protein [Fusobacterium ulcerans]
MFINKIHHAAIICSNYEKSKDFYVNILGFKILKETYRSERKSYKLDLEIAGEYQIELFSFPDPPERITSPEARGLRHLAFEVDDIENSVKYLNEKNIVTEPIKIDVVTGKKYTFFRDPDNLPLEICEK